MMCELSFGTGAALSWAVMSAIFVFLATYMWLIVAQVGGIRGTAMGMLFSALAVVTGGFSLLLSQHPLVPTMAISAISSTMFLPILLACLVLADLYAADRNSHRSFTTRAYIWYQRVIAKDKLDGKQSTF